VCENCGHRIFPRKRLEKEKCRICGEPIKPTYVCRNCKNKLSFEEFTTSKKCPKCGKPIPKEKVESKNFEKATMKGDELTVELAGGESAKLESVNEVSLNIFGKEFGRIENPDYAEFSTIEDFEETEEGVDLHFQPEEKNELLEKIKELQDLKSSSSK
jgi:predicted RNA-binding Zn-ribbon protein involved in translation (DUF1610 family)